MKYSLNSRQTKEYLAQADEIVVNYLDREQLLDLITEFPNAEYVLSCGANVYVNEAEIDKYETLLQNQLTLCFYNINYALSFTHQRQKLGKEPYPLYYGYPITTFYELTLLLHDLHPKYVVLGAELMHSLDKIKVLLKNDEVQVRCAPNIATYYPYGSSGVEGGWIRPEDLDSYSDIISIIEFPTKELSQERALFRIYKQDKKWQGRLDLIITNLHTSAINRMIPPNSLDCRKNCHQVCMSGGACRSCNRILQLANPELFKQSNQETKREL